MKENMLNWVLSDCIMVQFVCDIFYQLYAITSDLIFQLYKGVTPVKLSKKLDTATNRFKFQNFKVIEWCNFKLSVEIEIKEGFERRPRASATLRLFRK